MIFDLELDLSPLAKLSPRDGRRRLASAAGGKGRGKVEIMMRERVRKRRRTKERRGHV